MCRPSFTSYARWSGAHGKTMPSRFTAGWRAWVLVTSTKRQPGRGRSVCACRAVHAASRLRPNSSDFQPARKIVNQSAQMKVCGGNSRDAAWLTSIQTAAESWSAERVLEWADQKYGERVAIASAFGIEGIVLIDITARVWRKPRVFVLDTAFLFPETIRLMEKIEARYQIAVERVRPALTPQAQVAVCGPRLWKRNPDLCCYIRK